MISQGSLARTVKEICMLPNESEITAQSLSRLWPNRLHESNCFKNLFCYFGLHRWARLDLSRLAVEKDVRFCRWCSSIKMDGVIHKD
jgi:hypothetical protein